MTYQINLRREDALASKAIILSLSGGFIFQRMKIVRAVDQALGLSDEPVAIASLPARITFEVSFESLNALWFALIERAEQATVSGADFLALERVALFFRLSGRWVKHFEAQTVTECPLALDEEEEVDLEVDLKMATLN